MAGRNGQLAEGAPEAAERFFQFALLGMLASGYCAVVGSRALDWPSAVLAGAALVVRGLMTAGVLELEIPPRWVSRAAAGYALFYPLDYLFLSGEFLAATVHLVFFVAIVKLLTARTRRDYFFLEVIAFLELLAASIVSANASFFVFLVLFLFFTIATLASGEIRRAAREKRVAARGSAGMGRRLVWLTAYTGLGILLITAGLFFVLPRTARAALEKLAPVAKRVAGYSNEVTLGQMGEIRQRGGAVMHVRFQGERAPGSLKWRGNALAEFNGWKWYNTFHPPRVLHPDKGLLKLAADNQLRRQGPRLTYEVLLHTPPSDALFVAGLPEHLWLPAERVVETATGALKLPLVDTENYRYVVYSFLGGPATAQGAGGEPMTEDERNFHLRLPPVDPRIIALARTVTRGATNDRERARAIENYLRTRFEYSLAPLEREPDDPLAYFLLERRKGHCEYFASAMAVMLRVAWVPSRVATGFLNGSHNPLSGWTVVRGSDAHAWVEAWIPGQGWMAYDPTPPDPSPAAGTAWSRMGMWLDAVEVFWQEWVLGYDLDRQMTLAFQVDQGRRRFNLRVVEGWWTDLKARAAEARARTEGKLGWIGLLAALVLAAGVAAPRVARWLGEKKRMERARRGEASPGDGSLLYRKMLAVLRRRGYVKDPAQTALEFARSLPETETAQAVEAFTLAYHDLRFGRRPESAAQLPPLLDRIEQMRHAPR